VNIYHDELSAELMRRIRHFGDFVTLPIAIVIFADLAGVYRLYLVLIGIAAWTLVNIWCTDLFSIVFL
jgi:hypothetical protein